MKAVKKAYTVTDLGPGDGGKGGVVHKLCSRRNPHTVIKVGGAQGSHGVRTLAGEEFAFSQYGCGTFNDVPTFVSRNFVFDPNGALNEAAELKYAHGVYRAFDMLTIDERALCITPFHGIESRLSEIARKNEPRGTIGVGVGVAYRDSFEFPSMAIRARDLLLPGLREKIEEVRRYKIGSLWKYMEGGFLPEDEVLAWHLWNLLNDHTYTDWIEKRYREAARMFRIVGPEYFHELLSERGTIVVESSHGVLTDRTYGFYPHTSKMRTLPSVSTWEMMEEEGYDGSIVKLGVTRAYQIRHGAGPMVTYDEVMTENLLPGSSKDENRYQGKVRIGPLDFVSLRYALEACGGPDVFDGLAITWLDQARQTEVWKVCDNYAGELDPGFFSADGSRIVVCRGTGEEQDRRQARLTKALLSVKPVIKTYLFDRSMPDELFCQYLGNLIEHRLGVPVRMFGLGPTEKDKVCR